MSRKYKRYKITMVDGVPHTGCRRCEKLKPTTEFYKNKHMVLGICSECKDCHREKSEIWRKNNPEKKRATQIEWHKKNRDRVNKRQSEWRNRNKDKAKFYTIKNVYGLSREEYVSILSKQENKCPICNLTFGTGMMDKPHVDHCHSSGNIRGILCTSCNKALGLLKDSVDNMERAIHYLRKRRLHWLT